MPTVSVIVPNYNHARFLRHRIDTIFAQSYQGFELILLDDCSTDGSRSILSEYASDPRVRLEFNQENSGSTFKQWNKGVGLARAEYVWIAESDDYADKHFLERLLPILQNYPQVQFAYCRSWSVTEDNQLDGFADTNYSGLDQICWDADFHADGQDLCRRYMVRGNIVQNASAVLFRRAAYIRAGGADDTIRLCGDWRLWASLMLTGEVAYLAEPLNYFRFHAATVRNKLDLSREYTLEWLAAVRWIIERANPTSTDLKKACAEHARHWVPAVLSLHVPWKLKREILDCVRAIDPHPFRRVFGPAVRTLELKVRRHWRELRGMVLPART
jgi:glycosyltransferase involved in cell wall biosynthesis